MHGDTYPYVVSVSFGMEIVDVKGCRGVSKLRHLCFFAKNTFESLFDYAYNYVDNITVK